MLEDCYGINLRHLQRMAEQFYGDDDLSLWMPHTDAARGPYTPGMLHRCAVMHKAVTILMLKMECCVIDRNPDFKMKGRDFLRHIDWEKGNRHRKRQFIPPAGYELPHRRPRRPPPGSIRTSQEWCSTSSSSSFRQSEKLQQHIEFLYAKGSVYRIENGNLLYHGVVPMTRSGRSFAVERFEGHGYFRTRPYGLLRRARPPGLLSARKALLRARAGRTFCGICGAASCRRCSAAAP